MTRLRTAWAAVHSAVAVAALCGCQVAKPGPTLDSVVPNIVPTAVSTQITISGTNFFGEVTAQEPRWSVDLGFTVVIGGMSMPTDAITFVDPTTIQVVIPAGFPVGNHAVRVKTPSNGAVRRAEMLTVVDARLVIEHAPGGIGTEVGTRQLTVGRTVELHSALRTPTGEFVGDADVNWSVSGLAGLVTEPTGTSTVFEATAVGQATITATSADFGTDETGVFNVVAVPLCVDPAMWWDSAWRFRRQLTFNNADQAQQLDQFPVLVVLDEANFNYASTQPNGSDLRFIDDDAGTELAYHIEQWSPTGRSFIWVNVTAINASSTTDHITMYYGNPSAGPVQNSAATYDGSYAGVWHLDETTGAHVDAAAAINCTWSGGGGTQDAIGLIAGANEFQGSSSGVNCGTDPFGDSTDHTITAWLKLTLSGQSNQQIVRYEAPTSPFGGITLHVHRSDGAIGARVDSELRYAADMENRVAENQWTFVAVRGHKDAAAGFVEVSANAGPWETVFSGDTSSLTIQPGSRLFLGWGPGSTSDSVQGIMDEIRIASVARSDEWIRAQYLSSTNALITDEGELAVCP